MLPSSGVAVPPTRPAASTVWAKTIPRNPAFLTIRSQNVKDRESHKSEADSLGA